MTWALSSAEKASPLIETALRPAFFASAWKPAVLYQPGEPGLSPSPLRSKNTPSVAAPEPKAAEMREASP